MEKRALRLSQVYRLLEPGPVVLVTTAAMERVNVMTMSWQTMIEFEPPTLGCVISNRNYSFDLLMAGKECVINVPAVELVDRVVGCGNTSGRKVDKFRRFGLTARPAAAVSPPLIDECFANLECRIVDARMVPRYNLFVLEVVKAWIDRGRDIRRTIHHLGRGSFMVAGETIKLASKMK